MKVKGNSNFNCGRLLEWNTRAAVAVDTMPTLTLEGPHAAWSPCHVGIKHAAAATWFSSRRLLLHQA